MYALAVLSFAVLAGQGESEFQISIKKQLGVERRFAAVATPFANAGSLAALLKRQSTLDPSQIPTQCQSQCNGAVNSLNVSHTLLRITSRTHPNSYPAYRHARVSAACALTL